MTVELDNIIKNLNGKEIKIELFNETGDNPELYISSTNDTGIGYNVQSVQDVLDCIKYYLFDFEEE